MEINISSILTFLVYLILGIYTLSLVLILIYSLTQLNMLRYFLKYQKKTVLPDNKEPVQGWQKVTVQLPLFNDLYAVERLLQYITP